MSQQNEFDGGGDSGWTTSAEKLVEKLGLVDGKSVDWTGLGRYLLMTALMTVVYFALEVFRAIRNAIAWIAATYQETVAQVWLAWLDVPLTAIAAAGNETVAWLDLFGPAAFPLAVVAVVISSLLIQSGVRMYVG